jgi:hypothetical protein
MASLPSKTGVVFVELLVRGTPTVAVFTCEAGDSVAMVTLIQRA